MTSDPQIIGRQWAPYSFYKFSINNNNNNNNQSGPLTHGQSHQAQNTVEHTEVKQRRANWTKKGNKRSDMVLCVKQRRANWTKKVNKRSDNGAMCKTKKGQLDQKSK